ncbi:hypothetical protein SGLAM104S_09163 [Streptomyces glaucescens]
MGSGGVSLQDLVLGRRVSARARQDDRRADRCPDQLSDSPRSATPAAIATTGMEYE